MQHGRGIMTYSSDGSAVQERYEGEWVDGKMQGRGTYQYSDGSVYDGGWVAGKMQGKGVFVYPNGNRYEGEFHVSLSLVSAGFRCCHCLCWLSPAERRQGGIRGTAVQERRAIRGERTRSTSLYRVQPHTQCSF